MRLRSQPDQGAIRTADTLNNLGSLARSLRCAASEDTNHPPRKIRVVQANDRETEDASNTEHPGTKAPNGLHRPRRTADQNSHNGKFTGGLDIYALPSLDQPKPVKASRLKQNHSYNTRKMNKQVTNQPKNSAQLRPALWTRSGRSTNIQPAQQPSSSGPSPVEVEYRPSEELPVSSRTRNKNIAEVEETPTEGNHSSGKATSSSQGRNDPGSDDALPTDHVNQNQEPQVKQRANPIANSDAESQTSTRTESEAEPEIDSEAQSEAPAKSPEKSLEKSSKASKSKVIREYKLDEAADLHGGRDAWVQILFGIQELQELLRSTHPRILDRRTRQLSRIADELMRLSKLRHGKDTYPPGFREATRSIGKAVSEMTQLYDEIIRSLSKEILSDVYKWIIIKLVKTAAGLLRYSFHDAKIASSTLQELMEVLKIARGLIISMFQYSDKPYTEGGIQTVINNTIKPSLTDLIKAYEGFLNEEAERERARIAEAEREELRLQHQVEEERKLEQQRLANAERNREIDRCIFKSIAPMQLERSLSRHSSQRSSSPQAPKNGSLNELRHVDAGLYDRVGHNKANSRSIWQMNGSGHLKSRQSQIGDPQTPSPPSSEADGFLAPTATAPLNLRHQKGLPSRPFLPSRSVSYSEHQDEWEESEIFNLIDGLKKHRYNDRYYRIWKESTGHAGAPLRFRTMDDIVTQARWLKKYYLSKPRLLRDHPVEEWLLSVAD